MANKTLYDVVMKYISTRDNVILNTFYSRFIKYDVTEMSFSKSNFFFNLYLCVSKPLKETFIKGAISLFDRFILMYAQIFKSFGVKFICLDLRLLKNSS